MSDEQPNLTPVKIPIWDSWVRLFHWSLALSVLFMLVSGNTGFQFYEWHRYVGEFILALIVFRLVWGVIGSSNARLVTLVQNPRHAVAHILDVLKGRAQPDRGHNAAGSWAVIAMLGLIGTQAVTGMFIADEDELVEGAYYGNVSSQLSDLMYRIHHSVAEFIQIIVIVHVVMVFFYLFRVKQNLIVPMLTGRMQWTGASRPPDVKIQHWMVGLMSAVVCFGLIGYLASWF